MLHQLRKDYQSESLDINDLDMDPVRQFDTWFQEALKAGVTEPNAMTLATCTPAGKPSARIVLLKDYSNEGFTFFTNYKSRKGDELRENPNVALVFFWMDMHRQVRIEGKAEKVGKSSSAKYFQSRPKGSQIGAWASPQSSVLDSKDVLMKRVMALEKEFEHKDILPLPEFWGGYLVRPSFIEFWQGQPSRLHDRFRYTLLADGAWKNERLAP